MWKVIVGVGILGALGAVMRFGCYFGIQYLQRLTGSTLPYATLFVNVLGCLLFGLVWAIFEHRTQLDASWRVMILTGFMGAFTTYSTFAFETTRLLEQNQWGWAGLNVLVHTLAGIAAVFLGVAIGKALAATPEVA